MIYAHECDIGLDLGQAVTLTIYVDTWTEEGVPGAPRDKLAEVHSAFLDIGALSLKLTPEQVRLAVGDGPINAACERLSEVVEGERDDPPSSVPGWEYA